MQIGSWLPWALFGVSAWVLASLITRPDSLAPPPPRRQPTSPPQPVSTLDAGAFLARYWTSRQLRVVNTEQKKLVAEAVKALGADSRGILRIRPNPAQEAKALAISVALGGTLGQSVQALTWEARRLRPAPPQVTSA